KADRPRVETPLGAGRLMREEGTGGTGKHPATHAAKERTITDVRTTPGKLLGAAAGPLSASRTAAPPGTAGVWPSTAPCRCPRLGLGGRRVRRVRLCRRADPGGDPLSGIRRGAAEGAADRLPHEPAPAGPRHPHVRGGPR